MYLTAESAHFKERSWKPHLQPLFISYWSPLAAREAGKCSLSRALAPNSREVPLLRRKGGWCVSIKQTLATLKKKYT